MDDFIHPGTKTLLSIPLVSTKNDNYELINVLVFTRHSARTPIDSLISEKWENKAVWTKCIHEDTPWNKLPYELINANHDEEINESDIGDLLETSKLNGEAISGKTTTKGQEEFYELGGILRKRYSQALYGVECFDQKHFYLQSSGFMRSVVSAKCLFAGLRNIMPDQVEKEKVKLYASKVHEEIMLPNFLQIQPLIMERQKGKTIEQEYPQIMELKKKLLEIFGVNKFELRNDAISKSNLIRKKECLLFNILDEYVCRMYHDMVVPEEFVALLPEINWFTCEEIFFESFGMISESMNLANIKMVANNLVSLILKIFNSINSASIDASKNKQLEIYVGHDFTLLAILLVFQSFNHRWPPYGEHIVFETYRDGSGRLFIQMIYSGKIVVLKHLGASEEHPLVPIQAIIDYLS